MHKILKTILLGFAAAGLCLTACSEKATSGSGVKRNAAKALEWLETAAQNGNAKAQYDLGARLYLGQNGSPQPVKGRFWLKKAAAQKYAPAREFLKTHS